MTDQTIDKAGRAKLYRKIAVVTAAMKRVPKNGENTFHHYKYATESDLVDAIRDLLHENGLAFLPPTVLAYTTVEKPNSKQGDVTRVQMEFTIACTDTGETISSVLFADGQDAADKSFYKAYTGGVKYFLMKTFLVATGDDPEQDDDRPAQKQPAGAQYQSPRQQPAAPRQEPAQNGSGFDVKAARAAILKLPGYVPADQPALTAATTPEAFKALHKTISGRDVL